MVYVTIPIRPHLKKYLVRKEKHNLYKDGWTPTNKTVLGLSIINLFTRISGEYRPYYKQDADDDILKIYVPESYLKHNGYNLDAVAVGTFIQLLHRSFDEDLQWCIELTHHKVWKGINRFMDLMDIDYDHIDAIRKSNYRYRKLFDVSLISLSKICNPRMVGGIVTVNYIPLTWINITSSFMVPDAGFKNVGNIVISPGKSILEMPVRVDTGSLNISGESDENGSVFHGKFHGFYPAISQELIAEMNKMVGLQFLVWVSVPGQYDIILGDLNRGAEFSFEINTNEKPGDRAGVDITWTWDTGIVVYKQTPS